MTPAPAHAGARTDAPLHELPGLLRDEPALAQVLGRASATLAVAESARAIVTAGLAGLTSRSPIVLAVPTSTEAERLAHDLAVYLGRRRGRALPGMGDAALRARQPRGRDHGPADTGVVAAARC